MSITDPTKGGAWTSANTGNIFSAGGNQSGEGLTNSGAAIAGAGIEAGTALLGGAISAVQGKRAREAEYNRGLDEIFETRRRMDEQERFRLNQENHKYFMENAAVELDSWQRKVKSKEQEFMRGYENLQRMAQSAQSDEQMRDILMQMRSMGGGQ